MASYARRNQSYLLAAAREVAMRLKIGADNNGLRIRTPSQVTVTHTEGWSAVLGGIGRSGIRLEMWLDRFSGHPDRKMYAGFHCTDRPPITSLTKRVTKELFPVRTITMADIDDGDRCVLSLPLRRYEFNAPILEKYKNGDSYFGIYAPMLSKTTKSDRVFCNRAVAFFQDVAKLNSRRTKLIEEDREIYPKIENRKKVLSHLHRERSRYLAEQCKCRDHFSCRVCDLRFNEVYGQIGQGFAEAHHLLPLGRLRGAVKTEVKDLITVCANCHRMLHRMEGESQDWVKLRKIVRRRKLRNELL